MIYNQLLKVLSCKTALTGNLFRHVFISKQQLQQTVTLYDSDVDEYYPLTLKVVSGNNILDDDHIVFVKQEQEFVVANSGIVWIDLVFDFGVMVLLVVGDFLGITYEEINVYLFCIVWPLSLVFLVLQSFWIIKLSKINNRSIT